MILDDTATVIRLACMTEDRSTTEQRALLAEALRVDLARGSFARNRAGRTVVTRDPAPPELFVLARDTYAPSEGRWVTPTSAQMRSYEAAVAKWAPCPTCKAAMGCHPDKGCPTWPMNVIPGVDLAT